MSTIPETTLAQLGGSGRLVAMIGAHSFTQDDKTLTFKFKSRAKNGSNCIQITLDPCDTYTVKFISLRGMSMKTKAEVSDVYDDCLKRVIESTTGLCLSL